MSIVSSLHLVESMLQRRDLSSDPFVLKISFVPPKMMTLEKEKEKEKEKGEKVARGRECWRKTREIEIW